MPNGQLESHQLTAVDGLYLSHIAAAGWNAMRADCKAATGVDLRIAKPYGAYRSLTAQRIMYENRDDYAVPIARPGYSTHGTGMAVDATLATFTRARVWLLANCERYGFAVPPTGDPNHFAHRGTTQSGGTIVATVAEIVSGVWNRTVSRGGKKVTLAQEVADAKTNTIAILARLDKLAAPTVPPLTPAQLDDLATKVAAKITIPNPPTRGTITLE